MIIDEHVMDDLEETLRQRLESDLVAMVAEYFDLDAATSLSLYYSSRLAQQISEGFFGIQYLDAKYLFEDLLENEASLFAGIKPRPSATR